MAFDQQKIAQAPHEPGVYLMKDAKGDVLYVGKAKDLRKRLQSYAVHGRDERWQVKPLLKEVANLETIVTHNEKEALLLEHTLIRKHRPKFNILLRDDKSYASIKLSLAHPFPGIYVTRKLPKDGSRYFGPYPSGSDCRQTVEWITKLLGLRTCTDREFHNRSRPCLLYDIGRCLAPCVGKIAEVQYHERVRQADALLGGKPKQVLAALTQEMTGASEAQAYEEAARYRDAIRAVRGTVEPQDVVRHEEANEDYVAWYQEKGTGVLLSLQVRHGKVVGQRAHFLDAVVATTSEIGVLIESFLWQHYAISPPPPWIYLSHLPESAKDLADLLSEKIEGKVALKKPARGKPHSLLKLALKNAREAWRQKTTQGAVLEKTLVYVAEALDLPEPPRVAECVDISNVQGKAAYGAIVQFLEGKPHKAGYKLFRIRSLATPDDYTMMAETLRRRFDPRHAGQPHWEAPDLLIVDGGKGQLARSLHALAEVGRHDQGVVALTKGEGTNPDQVYLPGQKNPLALRANDPALLWLQQVRDEAHRFGLKHHRTLRSKMTLENH